MKHTYTETLWNEIIKGIITKNRINVEILYRLVNILKRIKESEQKAENTIVAAAAVTTVNQRQLGSLWERRIILSFRLWLSTVTVGIGIGWLGCSQPTGRKRLTRYDDGRPRPMKTCDSGMERRMRKQRWQMSSQRRGRDRLTFIVGRWSAGGR